MITNSGDSPGTVGRAVEVAGSTSAGVIDLLREVPRQNALVPRELPPLILAYHGVGRSTLRRDPHLLLVSARALQRHLRTLCGWGYQLLTFQALAARVANGDGAGCAAITFDDALGSLADLPVLLHDFDAPATVFAVSTWLEALHPDLDGARTLGADGLRSLAASGIEIGSHSETHADLQALGYEGARRELERSGAALSDILQASVLSAAYPYGRADDDTRRACRDAGYQSACRTTGEGSWDEPFDLPRQDMDEWSGRIGLKLKRDERYEQLMRVGPARAARRVGRAVRSALA